MKKSTLNRSERQDAFRGEKTPVSRAGMSVKKRIHAALDALYAKLAGTIINPLSLAVFSSQFAVLTGSGVNLLRCLDILSQDSSAPPVRTFARSIRTDIEQGLDLSSAVEKFEKSLPPYYVPILRSGEKGGFLARAFLNISLFMEKDVRLVMRVKNAMVYPLFLLSFALGCVVLIVKFIFPKFMVLFTTTKTPLPFLTRAVMALTGFFDHPAGFTIILLSSVIFILLMKYYIETPVGRENLDRLKLALPVAGGISQKVALTRFFRTVSLLTMSGIPIVTSIATAAKVVGNSVILGEIRLLEQKMTAGMSLSESFRETTTFPKSTVYMLRVAEETDKVADMLGKLSDYYELEIEGALDRFATLLEPVIISVLGVIVGTLLLSVYIPLYQVMTHLGR